MRKILSWVIVAVIVGAGVVSCTTIIEEEPTPVEFTTIAKGGQSTVTESDSVVISDEETWEATWASLVAHLLERPPPPEIDFGDYILLAHFMGQKPTSGYEVEFTEVLEGDEISVTVKEVSPAPECILPQVVTAPYDIIQIQKTDKNVNFIVEREIEPCPDSTLTWSEWPTFHWDSHRAGCGGGGITTIAANLMWTHTLQSPAPSGVPSSPVVSKDGTVYVGTMGAGYLHAINASSGSQIWKEATTDYGSISAAPTISPDGTRVYVCTLESNGINPNVLAYDAATGAKLWTAMNAPDYGLILPDFDYVSSSNPVAVDIGGTTVIFVCGTKEHVEGGSTIGRYRLYRIEDHGNTATCSYHEVGPLPAVPLYGAISPSPAVADDRTVYVTTSYDSSASINGALYAIDGTNLLTNNSVEIKWYKELATTPAESAAPLLSIREDGGLEIIYCGTTDWQMWKLKEDPGETSASKIWNYQTAANTWPITCPAIANLDADAAGIFEVVFTALSAGATYVYSLHDDGNSCSLYWSTTLPDVILGSPAVGGLPFAPPYQYHVFLGGGLPTGGTIYTLNGWDGAWDSSTTIFDTGGMMVSSPAVSWGYPWLLGGAGWVFATSNDSSLVGNLYAFGFVP